MTHAIVLIEAERGAMGDLGGALADVEGVAEAWSVTGEWDFVAMLRVRSAEEIAEVVTGRMAKLPGIRRTSTMVAFEVFSRHDLEALFSIGKPLEVEHAYHADPLYYEGRADGLLASATDGTPGAVAAFERAGAPLTAAGARAVVAAEHGCDGWADLLEHVAALASSDDPFLVAYRAVEAHDVEALAAALDAAPDVVREVGTNGNDLLGMAAYTCDERTVGLLLERGADVAHANAHGWTALHQAASAGLVPLARLLLDAGAPVAVEARGTGGTPLVVALFWGQGGTAELLAARSLAPGNLRVAAGLGDSRCSTSCSRRGRAAPAAGAARGFYRPHGGFPAWTPGDDPAEVVDEALTWAARNDRADALRALVERGARVDADVYRGTALAWAAATGRVAAIEALVALGADVDARGTFGGPQHGEADHGAPPRRAERRDGGGPGAAGRRRGPRAARRALRRHAGRLGGARRRGRGGGAAARVGCRAVTAEIDFDQFLAVDMRVGRVTAVEEFPEARKPAWKLTIDFGPEIGVKRSSAQITNYARDELEGRLVVAVVNFPPRQIGPFMSRGAVPGRERRGGDIILLEPRLRCSRSSARRRASRLRGTLGPHGRAGPADARAAGVGTGVGDRRRRAAAPA